MRRDIPRSFGFSRSRASSPVCASQSRNLLNTSSFSSLKPTVCSAALRIISRSVGIDASAFRTSTRDIAITILSISSSKTPSKATRAVGGTAMSSLV
eukprot:scaffold151720_cov39-Tisochrysis_lutea.AAC.3